MIGRTAAWLLVGALLAGLGGCKKDGPAKGAEGTAQEAKGVQGGGTQAAGGTAWPDKPADGAPVVVQFVSMTRKGDDPRAKMQIFNFADKGIRGVHLDLHYLGAKDEELKTFPWSQVAPTLVEAKSHSAQEMGAFIPEETARVTADVKRVEYSDGTEWRRPAD